MIPEPVKKPLASWKGTDLYQGEILPTLTIILHTSGCSWNRCLMCGYRNERITGLSEQALAGYIEAQIRWVNETYKPDEYRMVKLFTSGSFFDNREVSPEVRGKIARMFRGKLVIAETRPEFVTTESCADFSSGLDDGTWKTPLYTAIGLETTNDAIREKSICKGFTFADFCQAAKTSHECGAGVKAYLLHKPLFLTEKEALDDMHRSIADLAGIADLVSMNPCNVQNRTELEWYWKRGAYRPPYLWSVLDILDKAPVHVTCDPVGGGKMRGPHNCGTCDYELVLAIRDYSLNADRGRIRAALATECSCKNEWEFILREERPFCMPLTR
ncbi:MAG: archaeosine biosynthesis radical SAM protein RaSEA [Methanoregulaceae archaeon]